MFYKRYYYNMCCMDLIACYVSIGIYNVLIESSTYIIHLYKYKILVQVCAPYFYSFFLYKSIIFHPLILFICITIKRIHIALLYTQPVNVLGSYMCILWPVVRPVYIYQDKKPMWARPYHVQVVKPKQVRRARPSHVKVSRQTWIATGSALVFIVSF